MSGTIQFDNEKRRELFLWGNRAKEYLNNDVKKRRITRIYGLSTKGFAFHIGALNEAEKR
jgi:hypothetical protein